MLKIGITCYPLIGGSGILATALGSELARRGYEVHFFSSSKPVRLDLAQERVKQARQPESLRLVLKGVKVAPSEESARFLLDLLAA